MRHVKKRIAAVTMCAVAATTAFASCGGGKVDENFKDNDKFYTINWYMPINTTSAPTDLGKIQQEVNEYLVEKINAKVNITAYSFTEYVGKMGTKVANAEEFDLLWTDFESYPRYLEMEALYPLDSLIQEYGKDAYAKFPAAFWDQTRNVLDGKLYAVINNQILPRSFGMEVRDNNYYREYLTATASTITAGATVTVDTTDADAIQDYIADYLTLEGKLDVMENYLYWLRTNKGGENESCGGISWGMELLYVMEGLGFDSLGMSMAVPGVIRADAEGKPTVINQFETDEFKSLINRMCAWYEKGLIPEDIQSGSYSQKTTDLGSSRTWTPDYVVPFSQGGVKREREVMRFGQPYYIQSYINGTMWAISSTSKNPARTMKFINLLHTDAYLHNLLKLGIEGNHYNIDENGQAVQTTNAARYNLEGVRWIFGDETIGLTLNTQTKDVYEKVKKINAETPLSPVIGFAFDRSDNDVLTNIQLSSAVVTKYISNLGCGEQLSKSPNYYNEFIAELKSNGANQIIAEKQKQLDAWLAKKA